MAGMAMTEGEVRRVAIGKATGQGLRSVQPSVGQPVELYWRPANLAKIPRGAIVGPVELVDWYPRWDRKTARDMVTVSSLSAPWAPPWVAFTHELRVIQSR
jgi:hypothetical protein